MRLSVTFGAAALVGSNDGLDAMRSAERYAEALRATLLREWPRAEISVDVLPGRQGTAALASETEDAARIERLALDLAWVVKGCVDWAVREVAPPRGDDLSR